MAMYYTEEECTRDPKWIDWVEDTATIIAVVNISALLIIYAPLMAAGIGTIFLLSGINTWKTSRQSRRLAQKSHKEPTK